MKGIISDWLGNYERGKITRRELVQGLALLAAGAHAVTAAESTFQGIEINHVALDVGDVKRSRDFYQKLLGLPVVRESSTDCFLGLGRNFLALFGSGKSGVNHYCISIKDYEVGAVTRELERQGLNPRQPQGTNRVYFDDPNGVEVQLAPEDHFA